MRSGRSAARLKNMFSRKTELTNQEKLAKLKLDLLKQYLTKKNNGLNADRQRLIANAHSIGEVWNILFSSEHSINLYRELTEQGIFPSADEMSELRACNNTSAWYWMTNKEYVAEFAMLLKRGIYPTAELLSEISLADGVNTWHWLSGTDPCAVVFYKLICMDRYILPTAEALNRLDKVNTSTWFWLAASKPRCAVFNRLLDKNILPTAEILNQSRDKDGSNVWHWLASTAEGRKLFGRLLDMNILPSAAALNQSVTDSNENVWYVLAAMGSSDLLGKLIEKNILPSPTTLDACIKDYNTNAWFWLASNEALIRVFNVFVDKGILPAPAALNVPCHAEMDSIINNTNAWFWLAVTPESYGLLNRLLDKNILPSAAALNACRESDRINAWYCLVTQGKSGEEVAEKLVKRNIIPNTENALGTSENRVLLTENMIKLLEKADYRRGILGCLSFLNGLNDKESPVSILNTNRDVLTIIFSHVDSRRNSVAHNNNHLFATVRKVHPDFMKDHFRSFHASMDM